MRAEGLLNTCISAKPALLVELDTLTTVKRRLVVSRAVKLT